MKFLILVLILVLLAVAGGLVLRDDPGYVFLGLGEWSVETSLPVLALFMLVLFAALYVSLRALVGVWRLPRRVAKAAQHRALQRADRGLLQGLIELAEGRWERAERLLLRDAQRSPNALLHYLGAARAAQQQGAHERRDTYLKRAIDSNPEADVAVSLTQAELQLAHQQTERALATVTRLRGLAPKHNYVVRLLAKLYREVGDWQQLSELLPELRKRQLYVGEELHALELETWRGLLKPEQGMRIEDIQKRWDALPKAAREHPELVREHAERLIERQGDSQAETLLRTHLNRHWSSELARLYGLAQGEDAAKQLDHAESWLKNHGRDPMLLLSLGRLCKRRSLWGKARIYFESSLGLAARAETHLELGELLETLGEKEGALEHFRQGLVLSAGRLQPRRGGVVTALAPKAAEPVEAGEAADAATPALTKVETAAEKKKAS